MTYFVYCIKPVLIYLCQHFSISKAHTTQVLAEKLVYSIQVRDLSMVIFCSCVLISYPVVYLYVLLE